MLPARLLTMALLGSTLAASLGCGKDLPPLPIGLEFRQELPGQCPSTECNAYGLDCGAVISVRAFPGDSNPSTSETPVAESCVEVAAATDLCSLGSAGLALGNLPAQRLRIEVAIWSPDDVDGACPSGPMFDLGGLPLSTFSPQPAFAGSRVVDVGDDDLALAEIELACFNANPLGGCAGGETDIRAQIDDLDTLLFAPALAASNLQVSVGVPEARAGDGGETIHVIEAADDYSLDLIRTVPVPEFAATVPAAFPDTACLLVLDVTPQSTTAVTCQAVSPSMELDLTGYLVGKPRVNQLLAVLGEASFPDTGLVIGRVVDNINQPSANVTVSALTPTGGQAEVLYISEDFSSASAVGPTASHGYFVSRDAPFGTQWTALHSDGRREELSPRTGLIQGKVTALVVRLDIAISP